MRLFLVFVLALVSLFGVDINNADVKELAKLKGVGEAKAKEIAAYRDANGCFTSIDELAKVKGIGEKTVVKNKDSLTIGTCKK